MKKDYEKPEFVEIELVADETIALQCWNSTTSTGC